jgi:NitT/TauT family transport system ATP-binding protein
MNAPLQGHTVSKLIAAAQSLLSVDSVSLEYRTPQRVVRATHQVSFEVDPADRFVLLGPSGCGKSTLLKAAAGFIQPVEGEIRLQGQRVDAPGPDRIVVFQEFDQLPPWKTVKQNVMFPLLASNTLKRKGRLGGVCRRLSTYVVGRHEGARRHRPGVGDAAENPSDG